MRSFFKEFKKDKQEVEDKRNEVKNKIKERKVQFSERKERMTKWDQDFKESQNKSRWGK